MAPNDSVEKVATLADYPLADLVHARCQLLARNCGKEPGAQLLIGDGIIEDDPAKGSKDCQRNLDGLALAAELLVELVLGLAPTMRAIRNSPGSSTRCSLTNSRARPVRAAVCSRRQASSNRNCSSFVTLASSKGRSLR